MKKGNFFTIGNSLLKVVGLSICLAAIVSGCSNSSNSTSATTYRIESGAVSDTHYNAAANMISSYGSNITYSNIKTIRDYLYKNTSNHKTYTGVTIDQIRYTFLDELGLTKTRADAEIAKLEALGNDIALFDFSSSKVWIYVERE